MNYLFTQETASHYLWWNLTQNVMRITSVLTQLSVMRILSVLLLTSCYCGDIIKKFKIVNVLVCGCRCPFCRNRILRENLTFRQIRTERLNSVCASYLISSWAVDSMPCSTLIVAAASVDVGGVGRGPEVGAVVAGADVWGTGVVQVELTKPGSVLTM